MKAKRHKKIRNQFNQYQRYFDFEENSTLLLDGNFLKVSLDLDYDIF